MARLRVHAFAISLDGFVAGLHQRADASFGDGTDGLHDWMFATRSMRATPPPGQAVGRPPPEGD